MANIKTADTTTSRYSGSGWEANDSQFLRLGSFSLEGKRLRDFGLCSENELLASGQRQIANLTLGHGPVVVIECSAKYPGPAIIMLVNWLSSSIYFMDLENQGQIVVWPVWPVLGSLKS